MLGGPCWPCCGGCDPAAALDLVAAASVHCTVSAGVDFGPSIAGGTVVGVGYYDERFPAEKDAVVESLKRFMSKTRKWITNSGDKSGRFAMTLAGVTHPGAGVLHGYADFVHDSPALNIKIRVTVLDGKDDLYSAKIPDSECVCHVATEILAYPTSVVDQAPASSPEEFPSQGKFPDRNMPAAVGIDLKATHVQDVLFGPPAGGIWGGYWVGGGPDGVDRVPAVAGNVDNASGGSIVGYLSVTSDPALANANVALAVSQKKLLTITNTQPGSVRQNFVEPGRGYRVSGALSVVDFAVIPTFGAATSIGARVQNFSTDTTIEMVWP